MDNDIIAGKLGKTRLDSEAAINDVPAMADRNIGGESASEKYRDGLKKILELRRQSNSVSEQSILKDLLSVLRGFEAESIALTAAGRFAPKPRISLSGLTKGLLEQILMFGDTLRSIKLRVNRSSDRDHSGMGRMKTAYYEAVESQLDLYLEEISRFEKDLLGFASDVGCKLGLPELMCRLSKWTLFLHTLDRITSTCHGKTGSALLDSLLPFVDYSDHVTAKMTAYLFYATSVPLVVAVDNFIRTGCIDDPHAEFFLTATTSVDGTDKGERLDWWENEFAVAPDRIPDYLKDSKVVTEILSLGKTQLLLKDSASYNKVALPSLSPHKVCQMVDEWERIGAEQNLKAVRLIIEKYKLTSHLEAIKKFMLLAEGDFAQTLMNMLSDALSKPASSLFRHNLVGILEAAAGQQRAVHDADILARLDVRLLESANAKSQGWDIFCLDYRLDRFIAVVINNETMMEYARVSHFLWSMKRVEFVLANAWGKLNRARRSFTAELRSDQRRLELLISEMHTFIQQITSAAYQSIEIAWGKMIARMPNQLTPDDLMRCHVQYVSEIKMSFPPWSNTSIRNKLGQICASCLRTEHYVRSLISHAVLLAERDRREKGAPPSTQISEDRYQAFIFNHLKQLSDMRSTFQSLARSFQGEVEEFVGMLQRDASTNISGAASSALLAFVDLSGYHSRRIGFDTRKYANSVRL